MSLCGNEWFREWGDDDDGDDDDNDAYGGDDDDDCLAKPGTVGEEEHWRSCVSETDNILGFALGAMYVQEKFHRDSKESVSYEVRYISAFYLFIHSLCALK